MGLTFAHSLRQQYEARYQGGDGDAGRLLDGAEGVLEQVAENNPRLAEGVGGLRFALEHLTVGRTAMGIEGGDPDGRKFELSDYRGRVVVLDFWGDW